MFARLCFVLAATLLLWAGAANAQTPVRQAAERLAAALQSDQSARAALVRDGFTQRMLEGRSAEAWLALLDRAAAQSGGVDIVSVEPGESERFAEFTVRARHNGRHAWLVLGVSRADPSRISTLFLLPARDPQTARAAAWPEGRIDEDRLSQEIGRRVGTLAGEDLFSGAVLVARRGRIVHEQYEGMADRASGARNGPATRFNLGSMGKMFTAVAAARLIEEGRLSLDDAVDRWVPDYPDEAGRAISVEQLLSHTSGLDDFFGPRYRAAPQRYLTSDSYLPLIAPAPAFPPGAQFAYSNAGYALLGVVVERAAGEDYFAYIRRGVFAPAGMSGAGFPSQGDMVADRATGYLLAEADAFTPDARQPNPDAIAYRGNAAGGAYATARDMLAFADALFADRLISAQSRAMLFEPRNDFVGARTPERYGYGFSTQDCAGRSFVGHGGGGAQSGVDANLMMSVDGEWTIIVLSNYDPSPDDFARGLCAFIARQ